MCAMACTPIRSDDERFAHQHRIHARHAHTAGVVTREDATFADQNDMFRNHRRESFGHCQIDVKRAQVAIIDPDQCCASGKRALHLVLVMHLDQRFDADFFRRLH